MTDVTALVDLLRRLGETHRPVARPAPDAEVPGVFVVQCPACDGNSWRIWMKGDPDAGCDLWREYAAHWHAPKESA